MTGQGGYRLGVDADQLEDLGDAGADLGRGGEGLFEQHVVAGRERGRDALRRSFEASLSAIGVAVAADRPIC